MPTPVPADTVRTNLVWKLPNDDQAVTTLHFRHEHLQGNTLDWAGDMTQRYADLVRDALISVRSAVQGQFSGGLSAVRVDAYHLGTDGLTIDKRTSTFTGANAFAGTGTSNPLPMDECIVVSLYGYDPLTYTPQSARKRGRIYLPAVNSALLTNRGENSSPQAHANNWAGFFSYMAGRKMDSRPTGSERAHVAILSRANVALYDIVAVSVDQLFDTQRRRENKTVPVLARANVNQQS
jgi:hypothetical protein